MLYPDDTSDMCLVPPASPDAMVPAVRSPLRSAGMASTFLVPPSAHSIATACRPYVESRPPVLGDYRLDCMTLARVEPATTALRHRLLLLSMIADRHYYCPAVLTRAP